MNHLYKAEREDLGCHLHAPEVLDAVRPGGGVHSHSKAKAIGPQIYHDLSCFVSLRCRLIYKTLYFFIIDM